MRSRPSESRGCVVVVIVVVCRQIFEIDSTDGRNVQNGGSVVSAHFHPRVGSLPAQRFFPPHARSMVPPSVAPGLRTGRASEAAQHIRLRRGRQDGARVRCRQEVAQCLNTYSMHGDC